MKFDTSVLPTNSRGLSHLENVCVHEDGMEAKVTVDQDKVHWGRNTLHLYVACNHQFVRPDLVAAYIAYEFKEKGDQAIDQFFSEGFKATIPSVWIIDGQQVHENSMELSMHRSQQHKRRYKDRKSDGGIGVNVQDSLVHDRSTVERIVSNIIKNRVYKRDLQTLLPQITSTVIKVGAIGEKRSRVELMICKALTLKCFKDKIDKPTRDRTTANYRASDRVRNGQRGLTARFGRGIS